MDYSVQIFMGASKEDWGAHLEGRMAKGIWSTQESSLHINILEWKAVLLDLREFLNVVQNCFVLIVTDNSTVVAYINKKGARGQQPFVPSYGDS